MAVRVLMCLLLLEVNVAEKPAAYNRIHAKYLGVDMHDTAVWAFNPMYGSDPIYLQSFVVGEMVAHQIQHKTDQRFGTNWGVKAGQFLQSSFYSRGAGTSIDNPDEKRHRRITHSALPDPVLAALAH